MPNTFDEARNKTEELMTAEQPVLEEAPPAEETVVPEDTAQTEEPPADAEPAQATLENATQTAEAAAQAAVQTDAQLQQALQELEAERQHSAQLQGTIDELSKKNEENVLEEAFEGPPVLDMNALAFADEATIAAAQAKYAEDMLNYNRKQILSELEPTLKFAKEGMARQERDEAISVLSQIPQFAGIENMIPQLEQIITNNKELSSDDMPMDEKLVKAYVFAKGVDSMNAPPPEPQKDPTADELMAYYNNNPEFQKMVEQQRLETIKQSQQVPPLSASSGAGNAALNIKDKPKSFDEALERTSNMLGL